MDKEFLDGNIKTLNAELNKVQTEQDRLGKKSKLFIQEITSLTQSNIKDIEKKWKELHRGGLKGLDIILKEKSNDIKTHIQKIKEKGEQKIEDKLNKKILSIEKQTAKEIQDFHHQIANSFDSLNALNLEQSTLLNDSKNIKKTVEESNKELKLFEQQIKIKLEKEFEESIKKINNQWAEELHREISISKAEISKKFFRELDENIDKQQIEIEKKSQIVNQQFNDINENIRHRIDEQLLIEQKNIHLFIEEEKKEFLNEMANLNRNMDEFQTKIIDSENSYKELNEIIQDKKTEFLENDILNDFEQQLNNKVQEKMLNFQQLTEEAQNHFATLSGNFEELKLKHQSDLEVFLKSESNNMKEDLSHFSKNLKAKHLELEKLNQNFIDVKNQVENSFQDIKKRVHDNEQNWQKELKFKSREFIQQQDSHFLSIRK